MKLHFAFVIVTGLSGLIIACSGSTTGTSSGGTAGSSQAFIDDFCSLTAPCCARVNRPTDGASCRELYGALLSTQTYDGNKGNVCLGEMRARSSASDFCDDPTGGSSSCNGAFKSASSGAAQPGEDCTKDSDCASSSEGDVSCASSYDGKATTKSCQIEIEGKEGDMPCVKTRDGNTISVGYSSSSGDGGPTRPAARGYICDTANGIHCSSKTSACAKVQDVGGSCEGYDQYVCVKSAYCDVQQKTCLARKAVGEDCSSLSQSCVAKANCDSTTKKCVAGLATGADCTTSMQCESRSCTNGKCAAKGSDLNTRLLCGGN